MAKLDWYIRANLKPRHLQLLVTLDDFRNVSKAAQHLNVTQPAISKSLADIENGLSLTLFERSSYGLRPTLHGECLVRYARKILGELAHARDELHAISNGVLHRVAVGLLPGMSLTVMPMVLAQLKTQSPQTAVLVREAPASGLRQLLREGEIDLIVGLLPHRMEWNDIEAIELYADPLVLAVSAGHVPKSTGAFDWQALRDYLWILPPVGSLIREPIEEILLRHDISFPANYIESVSVPLNVRVLQCARAVGFLPMQLLNQIGIQSGITRLPLSLPSLVYRIGAMWAKDRPLTDGTHLLLDVLKAFTATLACTDTSPDSPPAS